MRQFQRRSRQGAILFPFGQGVVNYFDKQIAMPLARNTANDVPIRTHQNHRRPRCHIIRIPHRMVGIDHHRMMNAIPLNRGADVCRITLVVILRRMHAKNHHRLILVLFFQKIQIRNHMHAVDAAIAPEIHQDDLPLQVARELQRLVGVKPTGVLGQFGRINNRFHISRVLGRGNWGGHGSGGRRCRHSAHRKAR